MSQNLYRALYLLAFLSLIVLLPIEIFTHYDSQVRQLALTLTNLGTIIILFIIYRYFKNKHQIALPFYVAWLAALGVWFDAAGNFAHLYANLLWWDKLSHGVGSFAMAATIFVILYELNKQGKIKLGLFSLSVYTVSLTTFIAAIYEVTEYLGDLMFKTRRIVDLYDTPDDIMWNTIASFLMVCLAYVIIKAKEKKKEIT